MNLSQRVRWLAVALLCWSCVQAQVEVDVTGVQPPIVSNAACADVVVAVRVASCNKADTALRSMLLLLPGAAGKADSPTDFISSPPIAANCTAITYECFNNVRAGTYFLQLVQSRNTRALAISEQPITVVDAPSASVLRQASSFGPSANLVFLTVGLSAAPRELPASLTLSLADPFAAIMSPSQLSWAVGDAKPKSITLTMKRAASRNLRVQLQPQANLRISSASNWVSVDIPVPKFRFVADQAAFRSPEGYSNIEIPVVRHGWSALPSLVTYSTSVLDVQGCGSRPAACSAAVNATGVLHFQPFTDRLYASVGVRWDLLPLTATLRVGLELLGRDNAETAWQLGDTAVMLYGAPEGQCPPGTMGTAASGSTGDSSTSPQPGTPSGMQQTDLCSGAAAVSSLVSQQQRADGDDSSTASSPNPQILGCSQGYFSSSHATQLPHSDAASATRGTRGGVPLESYVVRQPPSASTSHLFIPIHDPLQELVTLKSTCSGSPTWQETGDPKAPWYYWTMSAEPRPCSVLVAVYAAERVDVPETSLQIGGGPSTGTASTSSSAASTVTTREASRSITDNPLLADTPQDSINASSSVASASARPSGRHPSHRRLKQALQPQAEEKEQEGVTAREAAAGGAGAAKAEGTAREANESGDVVLGDSDAPTSRQLGADAASTTADAAAAKAQATAAASDPLTLVTMAQKAQYNITILPTTPLSILGGASMYLVDRHARTYWPLCSLPQPLLQRADRCLAAAVAVASAEVDASAVLPVQDAREVLVQAVLGSEAAVAALGGALRTSITAAPAGGSNDGGGRRLLQQEGEEDSGSAGPSIDPTPSTLTNGSAAPAPLANATGSSSSNSSSSRQLGKDTSPVLPVASPDIPHAPAANVWAEHGLSFTLSCGGGSADNEAVVVYINRAYQSVCDPRLPLSVDRAALGQVLLLQASGPGLEALDEVELDVLPSPLLLGPGEEGEGPGDVPPDADATFALGGATGGSVNGTSGGSPQCDQLMAPGRTRGVALVAPDGVTRRSFALRLYDDYQASAALALDCAAERMVAAQAAKSGKAAGDATQRTSNTSAPTSSSTGAGPPSALASPDDANGNGIDAEEEAEEEEEDQRAASAADGMPFYGASALGDTCQPCPAGSFAGELNSQQCYLCAPGSSSSQMQRHACRTCAPGMFAHTFGASACRPCMLGTYAAASAAVACDVCPTGATTTMEGSRMCTPLPHGSSGSSGRGSSNGPKPTHAWLVSFQLQLNMTPTALSRLTPATTGINASAAEEIVQVLVRADTASMLRVPPTSVQVSNVHQTEPSSFYVNVSATVPVVEGESEEGAAKSGNAPNLFRPQSPKDVDADSLVGRLANPSSAFPRTSQATGSPVQVTNVRQQVIDLRSDAVGPNLHAILWPTLAGTLLLGAATAMGCVRYQRRRRASPGGGGLALPPLQDGLGLRWEPLGKEATSPPPTSPELGLELSDIGPGGGAGAAVGGGGTGGGVGGGGLPGFMAARQRLRGAKLSLQEQHEFQMLQAFSREGMLAPKF